MVRYVVVNLIALVLVYAFSMLFRWIFLKVEILAPHAEDYAHFIGVMVPAVSSYLFHKYWTFSSGKGKKSEAGAAVQQGASESDSRDA